MQGDGRRYVPIAMIPSDHMSTLGPYSLRVTTSGAIQYGVPTIVVRLACAGSEICAQKPKSANCQPSEEHTSDIVQEHQ
jgi:hypothetical protein